MSFTLSRDGNNKIIKSTTTISSSPTIDNTKSIGSTGMSDIVTVTSLNFNGISLTATSDQLNYLKVTPGVASASKAVVVDTNRSITGINTLSSTNLVVNGTNITASLYQNTTSNDLNSPYLAGVTPGTAQESKALIPNSLLNISNLNNISSKTITLNNALVSSPALTKNINLNSIYNNRVISSNAISSLLSNSTTSWNQITTSINAIDQIYWSSICWSPELGLFVAVGNGSYTSSYTTVNNRVMTSTDGYLWTNRNSAADYNWNSVCWSSSLMLFVAVASSGSGDRVMTSPDGINWTSRSSAADNSWNSICWSPELSLFVAVASSGNGNRVMTSPDGIIWTIRITPDNLSAWNSICWSPELNLFAVVASSGTNRIMISSNGINWTAVSEPTGVVGSWTSICWSPELSLFVAVANFGTSNRNYMRSSDGVNWYASFEPNNMTCQLITWSKDLEMFLVMDQVGQYFTYSYDAITWTRVLINGSATGARAGSIIWSSEYKMFIVVSNYNGPVGNVPGQRIWNTFPCAIGSKGGLLTDSNNVYINQSNNYVGLNTTNPGKPLEINSVTGNCFKLMLPSDSSKFWSLDVLNTGQFNINTQQFFNVTTDYSTYGLLLNNNIVKSTITELNTYLPNITNGVAQTSKIAVLNSSSDISGINSINCASLTVNGNNISSSNNNIYFQNVSSGSTTASKALVVNSLNNISGINNIATDNFILSNSSINSYGSQTVNINTIINRTKYSNGDISRAMNTWTARTTANFQYWSITWSPELGIFVALSTDATNRIITSTNGILWNNVNSTIANAGSWNSICWSSELRLFVAVGSSGSYIITSTDGINWTGRISPENNSWKSVCWSPELGLFVAVSINGTNRTMLSNDGINWYKSIAASALSWNSICWANSLGLFIAVSTDSISTNIMTSPDGINWTTRSNPTSQTLVSITWSQELGMLVVAAGAINYTLYSRDGINWYTNPLPVYANWNSVYWISDIGIFVMLTVSTVSIIYSFDGLNWITTSTTGVTPSFTNMTWSPELNMIVATLSSGTASLRIYTSDIFTPNSKSCILSNSTDFTVNNTNGRVGIGISSPSYQLQLSTDSASKASTSTWTISSDSRLKENIQNANLNICYNNVKNLRLTRYRWKDDVFTTEQVPDRSKLGWIAQEVETIFPKSVQKVNDHGFSDCRTLNTDQIIASLYGCTQKIISNFEDDELIFNSIREKINGIQLFIDSIPEE
jgi:hypothetical protein